MDYNINKDKNIKHKCNVLSNLLNPKKCAKYKSSHYLPILQDCMNTHSGREKFRNFRILLDSGSTSTNIMGNLKSKLKQKQSETTTW